MSPSIIDNQTISYYTRAQNTLNSSLWSKKQGKKQLRFGICQEEKESYWEDSNPGMSSDDGDYYSAETTNFEGRRSKAHEMASASISSQSSVRTTPISKSSSSSSKLFTSTLSTGRFPREYYNYITRIKENDKYSPQRVDEGEITSISEYSTDTADSRGIKVRSAYATSRVSNEVDLSSNRALNFGDHNDDLFNEITSSRSVEKESFLDDHAVLSEISSLSDIETDIHALSGEDMNWLDEDKVDPLEMEVPIVSSTSLGHPSNFEGVSSNKDDTGESEDMQFLENTSMQENVPLEMDMDVKVSEEVNVVDEILEDLETPSSISSSLGSGDGQNRSLFLTYGTDGENGRSLMVAIIDDEEERVDRRSVTRVWVEKEPVHYQVMS